MNKKDVSEIYDAMLKVESSESSYTWHLKHVENKRKELDESIKELQHSFQTMQKAKHFLECLSAKHGVV